MFWVVIPAYNTEDYIRETIDRESIRRSIRTMW